MGGARIAQKQRVFTVGDGYVPTDLLRFARDHLASAKVLWERSFDCFDSAGVLCQLGVELLLKALLLHSTGRFPATHDLRRLLRLIAGSPKPITLTREQNALIARIGAFFSLRYPELHGSPQIGTDDFISIEALFREILLQLPAELRTSLADRKRHQKGGRILMRRRIDRRGGDRPR